MSDYVHYECHQRLPCPTEALVDGLRRAKIRLSPHRLWFYNRLLKYTIAQYFHEDLFVLVCVLLLAYQEMENISIDQISDAKIEEIKAIYGVQYFPLRVRSFGYRPIRCCTGLLFPKKFVPAAKQLESSYKCFYNEVVHTVPLEWGFNSAELRSLLNVKRYQAIKACDKKGKYILDPVAEGFYNLRVDNPPSDRFVDENGFLWIEMIDFNANE